MSCVLTMQYDNSIDYGPVFMVESPCLGHCTNFLEADPMDNTAHQPGSKVRARESPSADAMINVDEVWYEWEGNGASGSGLEWSKVEDQMLDQRVQYRKLADGFEVHQTALTLVIGAR